MRIQVDQHSAQFPDILLLEQCFPTDCVGFANQKYFLLMLTYTVVICLYGGFTAVSKYFLVGFTVMTHVVMIVRTLATHARPGSEPERDFYVYWTVSCNVLRGWHELFCWNALPFRKLRRYCGSDIMIRLIGSNRYF